ncbi:MAG: HD-GYP domain-containing protein [Bacillota bacterium]|nr:HD-GYP domain-containing protein [Bacillota bacterium]
MHITGLSILGPGEALDRAEKKSTELLLLAKSGGVELMHQTIRAGSLFGLSPAGDGVAEFIYILSGECLLQNGNGAPQQTLGPSTCVASMGLAENVYFKAVSEITLIYVSTQPVFSYLSDQIAELVNIAQGVEEKDHYTAQHCERLQRYSTLVGERLGLPPHRMEHLIHAALLHDVGKAGIPAHTLGKPGPLTEEELRQVRKHSEIGAEMVARTYLKDVARIIAQHHERYDGLGYPARIAWPEFTLEAAIIGCVDAYDAMTTDRPYRRAMPPEEAVARLKAEKGKQFHPHVVDVLVAVLRQEGLIRVPARRAAGRNRS